MLKSKHPTHGTSAPEPPTAVFADATDFDLIRSMVPAYLFRVSSSSSQVSSSDRGFFSQSKAPLYFPVTEFRQKLSDHLLWKASDSPWISTTSSLLRALVFARWRCLQGQDDVRITMIDSRRIRANTTFPASYLVNKYGSEPFGKPWHDTPEGEYLVLEHIHSNTFLGRTTYKTISEQIETLLPELADKSHQLTENLREYYHGTQNELVRAVKVGNRWPITKRDYEAAHGVANAFGLGPQSLLLTLMCLSFRRREGQTLNWQDFNKDFAGITTVQASSRFRMLTYRRLRTVGMLQIFHLRHCHPFEHARAQGVAAFGGDGEVGIG